MKKFVAVSALALMLMVPGVSWAAALDRGESSVFTYDQKDGSSKLTYDSHSKSAGTYQVKNTHSGNVSVSEYFTCDGGKLVLTGRRSKGVVTDTLSCK